MPNGQVTVFWGDAHQVFNIAPIAQILELEDKCKCGVREILTRIRAERWYANDLRETIRLGLIGGGKTPEEAFKLIERYFDGRPLMESMHTAFVILASAIIGVPGDEVGKKSPADQTKTEGADPSSSVTTAVSSDPPSTDSAQPSDIPQETSMP